MNNGPYVDYAACAAQMWVGVTLPSPRLPVVAAVSPETVVHAFTTAAVWPAP